jgi:hypothetical protein
MAATSGKCNKGHCGSAKCLSRHVFQVFDKVLQMLRPARHGQSRSRSHNVDMVHQSKPMKTYGVGFFVACCLGSAMAEPGGVRVLTNGASAPLVVMPVSVQDGEPPAPARLRDTLRHPYDEQQQDLNEKPFRLSSEERYRLREQLRSHADAGQTKDKP